MNTQKILLGAALVAAGFIIGFGVSAMQRDAKVIPTESQASNKLFTWLDSSLPRVDNDKGFASIEKIDTLHHLMLMSYADSQETSAYGIYDYKNDILYTGPELGGVGIGGGEWPLAFVGNDKLLMYQEAEDHPTTLSVKDFHGKLLKTLLTNVKIRYAGPSFDSTEVDIYEDGGTGLTYILNPETLELRPYSPKP